MNDRSPTTTSTGPPTSSGLRSRTLVRSWTATRVVLPQPPRQLAVADVDRDHLARPVPQQDVGEAAGRGARVQAAPARDHQAPGLERRQRPGQLVPTARDVVLTTRDRRVSRHHQGHVGRHRGRRLGGRCAGHRHPPVGDQLGGVVARTRQAPAHQLGVQARGGAGDPCGTVRPGRPARRRGPQRRALVGALEGRQMLLEWAGCRGRRGRSSTRSTPATPVGAARLRPSPATPARLPAGPGARPAGTCSVMAGRLPRGSVRVRGRSARSPSAGEPVPVEVRPSAPPRARSTRRPASSGTSPRRSPSRRPVVRPDLPRPALQSSPLPSAAADRDGSAPQVVPDPGRAVPPGRGQPASASPLTPVITSSESVPAACAPAMSVSRRSPTISGRSPSTRTPRLVEQRTLGLSGHLRRPPPRTR